ncbi:MAG: hypothetical protein HYR94_25260 [Chloroflexi bacterium]|nr:hypothetical protein [Chloroflexota bacterium]
MIGLFFILLGLAGWLTTTWLIQHSDQPPDLSWPEWLFISLAVGVMLIGWLALTLVEIGAFNLPLLFSLTGLYTGGLALWLIIRKKAWYFPRRNLDSPWEAIALAALIGVGSFLFARPSESILGGADAGVYLNVGAHIAQTGQLLIRDEAIANIPANLRPGLLREQPDVFLTQYIHLPGFFVADHDPGLIIPQFFALYPAWLTTAISLFGLWGGLYTNSVCGMLGIVALYWAVRAWFGGGVAVLAAALLLLTPAQIYFARSTLTEPLTQFLLWVGFYGLLSLIKARPGHALWGVIAGLGLGQTALARIDMLPLIGLLLLWLAGAWVGRSWRPAHTWFAIVWLLLTSQAVCHALTLAWPYTYDTYQGALVVFRHSLTILALLAILGLGLAGLMGFWPQARRSTWWMARVSVVIPFPVLNQWARHLLSGLVVGLILYGYFVRPYFGQTELLPYWFIGGALPVSNHLNLVKFSWYVSPLGLGLAALGAVLIIEQRCWRRLWPVAAIGGVYSMLYLAQTTSNPIHLYAARRYLPLVIPTFLIAAAYGLVWLKRRPFKPTQVIAGLLGLALIAWIGYNDQTLFQHTDYQGLARQIEAMATALPKRSVLLFNDASPVGLGATVGTPLYYMYGYLAFDMQEERLDMAALNQQITAWWAEGRPVLLVAADNSVFLKGLAGHLTPVADEALQTSVLEASYDHFPTQVYPYLISLAIYEIRPEPAGQVASAPAQIDIGGLDYPFQLSGFYGREKATDGTTYRWTGSEAALSMPPLTFDARQGVMTMRVAAGRPAVASPAVMTLRLNGVELGQFQIAMDGFQTIALPFSTEGLSSDTPWPLTLQATTWNPSHLGLDADDRDLGIMIDWIEVGAGPVSHVERN